MELLAFSVYQLNSCSRGEQHSWWDGEQAQKCAGVLVCWCALCIQITRSAWVLVPRQGALGSGATPLKPQEIIWVLYAKSFKCYLWAQKNTRDMVLGYSHQTQASWDTHRCPLQATEHRPAACWSALGKIARIEWIYFVLYFKGLPWPGGQAGCSWSTPSLSWCRGESGRLSTAVQSPGMDPCTAGEMAFRAKIPKSSRAQTARQETGGWHP